MISDGIVGLIGCRMALTLPKIDSMVVNEPIGRSAMIDPDIV